MNILCTMGLAKPRPRCWLTYLPSQWQSPILIGGYAKDLAIAGFTDWMFATHWKNCFFRSQMSKAITFT